MDPGAIVTVFAVALIVVLSAVATYLVAIRQARREIVQAFETHIADLHRDHVAFVEKYDPGASAD